MRYAAFQRWLERRYKPNVAATRAANARRVEDALGDLDIAHRRDRLEQIRDHLAYSRADERFGVLNRSGIKISGDVYNGLATLRQAIKLYADFCAHASTAHGAD